MSDARNVAGVTCLACRRLGVTCAQCVVRAEYERSRNERMVEGVPYYPHTIRFTLSDGRKRRIVRWSPGAPWIFDEVGRELMDRYGREGIRERSVTIRRMVRS